MSILLLSLIGVRPDVSTVFSKRFNDGLRVNDPGPNLGYSHIKNLSVFCSQLVKGQRSKFIQVSFWSGLNFLHGESLLMWSVTVNIDCSHPKLIPIVSAICCRFRLNFWREIFWIPAIWSPFVLSLSRLNWAAHFTTVKKRQLSPRISTCISFCDVPFVMQVLNNSSFLSFLYFRSFSHQC